MKNPLFPKLFALLAFLLSAFALYHEFKSVPIAELFELSLFENQTLSVTEKFLVCLFPLAIWGVFFGYEFFALCALRQDLKFEVASTLSWLRRQLLLGPALSHLSNIIGVFGVGSLVLRFKYYYNWGLSYNQILSLIFYLMQSFWIGALFLFSLLYYPYYFFTLPLYLCFPFLTQRFKLFAKIPIVKNPFFFPMTIMGLVDLILHGLLFWILVRWVGGASLGYLESLKIYLSSFFVGLLSAIPGGFGAFEWVCVQMLESKVEHSKILQVLIFWRVLTTLMPAGFSACILVIYEILRGRWNRLKNGSL